MIDCIGRNSLNKFHSYIEYRTIFGNRKYQCIVCNSKISVEEFDTYQQKRKAWYEELFKNAPKIIV